MKTTIGVFTNRLDAEAAINDLRAMNIADARISYVSTNKETHEIVNEDGTSVGEGAASGATTGAIIGAIAGLVVANGILPGLGSLIVAGPLATALGLSGAAATTAAGAITGAAAGGLIGALANAGVSEEDARIYEERVRGGDILVYVDEASEMVKEIFSRHNAEEIRQY